MCIDMGMRFSVDFSCEKVYQEIFLVIFILVPVLEWPCTQEINFSKFLIDQNSVGQRISGKMLDQYY